MSAFKHIQPELLTASVKVNPKLKPPETSSNTQQITSCWAYCCHLLHFLLLQPLTIELSDHVNPVHVPFTSEGKLGCTTMELDMGMG